MLFVIKYTIERKVSTTTFRHRDFIIQYQHFKLNNKFL